MTIAELLERLESIPAAIRDREMVIFTAEGEKLSIRDDVSQFNVNGNEIHLFVKPVKDCANCGAPLPNKFADFCGGICWEEWHVKNGA